MFVGVLIPISRFLTESGSTLFRRVHARLNVSDVLYCGFERFSATRHALRAITAPFKTERQMPFHLQGTNHVSTPRHLLLHPAHTLAKAFQRPHVPVDDFNQASWTCSNSHPYFTHEVIQPCQMTLSEALVMAIKSINQVRDRQLHIYKSHNLREQPLLLPTFFLATL